ncbi:MAG: hypothetical protein M1831_002331 [Alyxoria varia]|nr:MAG: hypothetical protein M1831_002331 [Alyxoria varia]
MNNANLYEMNFMGIFYENYVPSDPTARKDYNEWLRGAMYVNDYDSNPALKVSLRALAVTRIGRLTKNNSLVVQGQVAYGNALKLLQYSLWDSQAMYSDSTLAAGRVLSCFEMFESNPSSANGWLGHQGGTARLVYLRGPEKYRETMKTGILDDFRYGLMISSLMTRQRSYLADPEWKTVPWRDTPKSFDDKLYDIGFSLGAAFEGFDDTLRFIDVEEAQTSLDKFTGLERDIRDWFEELAADDPTQALYWTTGSALSGPTYPAYTPNATDSKAQLPPLQFQTLLKAHQTILYWALRIIISALISTCLTFLHNHSAPLPSSIPGSASPSPPSPRHHHTSDTAALQKTLTNQRTHRLHLCALITRSVPYCLSDLWGSVGPSRCIFPLGVAIRELWRKSEVEDCEKELLQCAMELFGSISGGKGFGFAAAIGESADLYDVAPVLPVRYVDN